MEQAVFNQFRTLIYEKSGISLSDEKITLLSARIGKRLRALGIPDERSYLKLVMNEQDEQELISLLDVVSTNTTYFWREHEHYKFLIDELKTLQKTKSEIRLWCAASSSGEEPYNLALVADSVLESPRCKMKILATDISMTVLRRAQRGIYNEQQLKDLPQQYRERYFRPVDGDPGMVAVDERLKPMINFKRLNLSEFPYPLKGPLDFIFCRNVMIYFDNAIRAKVVAEFFRLLKPGGYLVLSKTESLLSIPHQFESHGMSVYQRPV